MFFWRPFVPRLLLFDIMENKTIDSMIFCVFSKNPPSRAGLCEKFKKHNSQGEVDE